jgi:alpha-amylase
VEQVRLRDEACGFQISLGLSPKAQLWRFPLETVSQSESGFQKTYQGTVLLFHWPFSLKPGEGRPLNIRLSFEGIRAPEQKGEAGKRK